MKKQEFIFIAKRMVKEYFNIYKKEMNNGKPISLGDVLVIGFDSNDGNYRIKLSIALPRHDDSYYELTYNKDTDEIKSSLRKPLKLEVFKDMMKKEAK